MSGNYNIKQNNHFPVFRNPTYNGIVDKSHDIWFLKNTISNETAYTCFNVVIIIHKI